MSAVAIGMNLLLAGLLAAALVIGVRLNARLKALRESHEGFARAVAELDAAAARAEQGLADLRAATDEAHDALADRIEKARALTAKLDRQLQGAPAAPASPADRAVSESDVERVTQRLGSLLSGARERRPERDLGAKRTPNPPKARSTFDDELFDPPAEKPTEPAPPRSAAARLGYRR